MQARQRYGPQPRVFWRLALVFSLCARCFPPVVDAFFLPLRTTPTPTISWGGNARRVVSIQKLRRGAAPQALGTDDDDDASSSECIQTAPFAEALWGRSSFPAVLSQSENVTCSVYEIGGALTDVLSTTCSKQLPLIPHVGVRIYGREYFYSDHVESRPVAVMAEMLSAVPQIAFDLGPPTLSRTELDAWLRSPDLEADWQPESYNVFDHNCNHFAKVMMDRVASRPLDPDTMQPVLAVTEEMLSELPDWRRTLGLTLMNQVTRLVVVSWGRATRKEKKRLELEQEAARAAAAAS